MWYVYILKSKKFKYKYIGSTNNLERRLKEHDQGTCRASSPYRPFELKGYIAVCNKDKAVRLEKYLKSGSGSVFSIKYML